MVIATIPAIIIGLYNTGLQANTALAELGIADPDGWRAGLLSAFGIGFNPNNWFACFVHGFLYFSYNFV